MESKELTEYSDAQLVNLALAKTDDFSYLIERYEAKLFRYIRRTLFVNKEDTEDILQEVFIKAYRNLNGFNPAYKFSSWIYRITYNTCISYYRSNQKHQGRVDLDFDKQTLNELISDVDIEADTIKELQIESVKATLNKLDEKFKTALVLRYLEDLDYEEISEIMQIPSGSVGSLINRGKKVFKDLLNKHG